MLKLNLTTQFKRDLKLCKKRNYNINLLTAIVNTLRIPAALRNEIYLDRTGTHSDLFGE